MSRQSLAVLLALATVPGHANLGGCGTIVATDTDPRMRWFCQAPGQRPTAEPGYRDCTNRHIFCAPNSSANAATPTQAQLVLFLPGTGYAPHGYSRIIADFARHGFYSLGLAYPSTQGQAGCDASRQPPGRSTDLNCTARERLRVLTGRNVSYGAAETHTNITQPDSIVNRATHALRALGAPWNGWLAPDRLAPNSTAPDWARIIVAGHSNGADHAAFLAKTFRVSRALLFAGANDYVDTNVAKQDKYTRPAPWQYAPGATPPERFYGFGVSGSADGALKASNICFNWHAGWGAQQLPGPWRRVDDALATSMHSSSRRVQALTDALAGYHRLCSNGSAVAPGCSMHMASAGDECSPTWPASAPDGLAGQLRYSSVYRHMLLDPIGARPARNASTETCACGF